MPSVIDTLKELQRQREESGDLEDDKLLLKPKPQEKTETQLKIEQREAEDSKQVLVKSQPKSNGRIGGFEI